jgi:hypothetical protein
MTFGIKVSQLQQTSKYQSREKYRLRHHMHKCCIYVLKVFNSVVLDDPRKNLSIFLIWLVFRVSSQQE